LGWATSRRLLSSRKRRRRKSRTKSLPRGKARVTANAGSLARKAIGRTPPRTGRRATVLVSLVRVGPTGRTRTARTLGITGRTVTSGKAGTLERPGADATGARAVMGARAATDVRAVMDVGTRNDPNPKYHSQSMYPYTFSSNHLSTEAGSTFSSSGCLNCLEHYSLYMRQ
jgi:hypothetical protein